MRRALTTILAAAALGACSDRLGPGEGTSPSRALPAAASAAITLDQQNGTLNEQNVTVLAKGFNPTNPHLGDAVVATFFWTGPAAITSVSDFTTDASHTPVGNTFHLVELVTAGGVNMATYVATNVQGFPDPNPNPTVVYAVQASMSEAVPDGGLALAAYSGVAPLITDALGGHSSGSGASSSATVSDAGSIPISAGAMAYAAVMANGIVGRDPPGGYTRLTSMSDNSLVAEADNMLATTSGTTDPQWVWGGFAQPSTWLASVVALNPAGGTTNQPPTAAFTSSCSALGCTFTNTSSDPDGSIATNSWDFGDGQTSTSASPSHTYATQGTYNVALTVTDNGGATNAVTHPVTVTQANQPPTAAFTSSCSGDSCSFTSTSSDPDGTIASYSWNFGDGAASTAQNPSHTYTTGGVYSVTLSVTDNLGATSSVSHNVTANQSPTAAFTSSCSALTCSFTSLSSDPDGTISAYSWNFGDGASSTAQNPSHTFAAGGTYTATLTVTDNMGATSSVSHSVVANTPPSVNAGPDEMVVLGALYTLNWSFSDPDNGPWTYTINWGDGSSSSGSVSSPGSYSTGHTYIGVLTTHTITVTVTDGLGARGSDTKVITLIL